MVNPVLRGNSDRKHLKLLKTLQKHILIRWVLGLLIQKQSRNNENGDFTEVKIITITNAVIEFVGKMVIPLF
jgi:hypothetical protein